ncbi:XkdX family protein [uncultured Lactobacillus sp.]|nr:XkdX family protein [uncultured Lactobacillus sp.]
MYNVCKAMYKIGLSIKKFVKMKSITAEQYEEITGKKYE